MSVNIPSWFVSTYNQNITQLLQQKQSRLRQSCMPSTGVGEQISPVDQIGIIEMQDVTARFQPMGRVDATVDRRWARPTDADLPQLIDTFDKLKIITDPQGIYVTNAVSAANRKYDDVIGNSFFAAAATGKIGATSTAFDTTNQVVVVNTGGTDSALNVAKLEAARTIFLTNEVDLENDELNCAITAKDHKAMMSEIQVLSLDFNKDIVYNNKGLLTFFRGINLIHTERPWLTTEATDDQSNQSRQLPFWVKSGMNVVTWNDINTSVSVRNDIQGEPYQVYVKMSVGATRNEEKKVIKIWCGQ
jgi:Phage capsid protein